MYCCSATPLAIGDKSTATQWQPWEAVLAGSGNHGNPYTDVDLTVNYTAPDGDVRSALGFWDGGAVWRIRSYFDRPGVCPHAPARVVRVSVRARALR